MAGKNEVGDRSYASAVRIVRLARTLTEDEVGRVLLRQILRAGTSIGANVEEAQSGESRKDFFHKPSIALKEARETLYWLRLLGDAEIVAKERLSDITNECDQIVRLLTSIVMTARKNS